jgi:hypothetical protein
MRGVGVEPGVALQARFRDRVVLARGGGRPRERGELRPGPPAGSVPRDLATRNNAVAEGRSASQLRTNRQPRHADARSIRLRRRRSLLTAAASDAARSNGTPSFQPWGATASNGRWGSSFLMGGGPHHRPADRAVRERTRRPRVLRRRSGCNQRQPPLGRPARDLQPLTRTDMAAVQSAMSPHVPDRKTGARGGAATTPRGSAPTTRDERRCRETLRLRGDGFAQRGEKGDNGDKGPPVASAALGAKRAKRAKRVDTALEHGRTRDGPLRFGACRPPRTSDHVPRGLASCLWFRVDS